MTLKSQSTREAKSSQQKLATKARYITRAVVRCAEEGTFQTYLLATVFNFVVLCLLVSTFYTAKRKNNGDVDQLLHEVTF